MVEHQLPKLGVDGSSPFARSTKYLESATLRCHQRRHSQGAAKESQCKVRALRRLLGGEVRHLVANIGFAQCPTRTRTTMPDPDMVPRADRAVVPREKLEHYLLDLEHPVGRHKARVFAAALGIHRGDWK